MSPGGNCWENVCSETLFGLLKVERLHGQRFVTPRQIRKRSWRLAAFLPFGSLHLPLACVSPDTFNQDWLAAQVK